MTLICQIPMIGIPCRNLLQLVVDSFYRKYEGIRTRSESMVSLEEANALMAQVLSRKNSLASGNTPLMVGSTTPTSSGLPGRTLSNTEENTFRNRNRVLSADGGVIANMPSLIRYDSYNTEDHTYDNLTRTNSETSTYTSTYLNSPMVLNHGNRAPSLLHQDNTNSHVMNGHHGDVTTSNSNAAVSSIASITSGNSMIVGPFPGHNGMPTYRRVEMPISVTMRCIYALLLAVFSCVAAILIPGKTLLSSFFFFSFFFYIYIIY